MKILSISPYLPAERTGHAGAQLIYRNLVGLANKNRVRLVTFVNSTELHQVSQLEQAGIEVDYIVYDRNVRKSLPDIVSAVLRIISSILTREPFSAAKYRQREMSRLVVSALADMQPDLVHIEYGIMNHYRRLVKACPVVITQHDIVTKLFQRYVSLEVNLFKRFLQQRKYHKWKLYEPRILSPFDLIIVLTPGDREYIIKWPSLPQIAVIPPQVHVPDIAAGAKSTSLISFVGSYERIPNQQAVTYILENIWPVIQSEYPSMEMRFAGRGMPREQLARIDATRGVFYEGFIDSIDEFIAKSILFLAPILTGAGFKMKITHSLVCSTSVLTTPVGAEGINVTSYEGLYVAEPDILGKKAVDLLRNRKDLISKGQQGRSRVIKHYSQTRIVKLLEDHYRDLLRNKQA